MPCARRRSSRRSLTAGGAAAQVIPSEPVTFGAGRVVIGGDAAVAVAPEDNGFFNYSDYEQSTLRQVRLGMTALVRLSDRISLLGELRSENFEYVKPFAIYARIRPLPDRPIDIQIGRIPPTFGSSSSRRTYGHDNPLIGSPLAYQYLTSLRADSAPADERGTAADARSRMVVELFGRQSPARSRRAAGQRVYLGHGRAGVRRLERPDDDGGGHHWHGLESARVRRQRRASRSPYGRRRRRPSA